MKKVIMLYSAMADPGADNWEDAKENYEKLPNWEFEKNPIYRGYLVYVKDGVKTRWEEKTVLKVFNATTKVAHTIWCNKVLAKDVHSLLDKMKDAGLEGKMPKIQIEYKGKAKGKSFSYHNYELKFDKSSILNPDEHPEIGQTSATNYSNKNSGASSSEAKSEATSNVTREATERTIIDEDLPF